MCIKPHQQAHTPLPSKLGKMHLNNFPSYLKLCPMSNVQIILTLLFATIGNQILLNSCKVQNWTFTLPLQIICIKSLYIWQRNEEPMDSTISSGEGTTISTSMQVVHHESSKIPLFSAKIRENRAHCFSQRNKSCKTSKII